MDDSALTHQLKQGNQLAFTILYDTYSEQVYRLAFKYLCNKELARRCRAKSFHESLD